MNKKLLPVFIYSIFIALCIWMFPYTHQLIAGSFSTSKITISDSRAGQSGVTYVFSGTTSSSTAIKEIHVQFCTNASGSCVTPTGIVTTGASTSDNLSGAGRSHNFSTNGLLITTVTTPTTQSPLEISYTINGVTNPTQENTTFFATISTYSDTGTTIIDTRTVSFAVLTSTSIAVSADVNNIFTVAVAPVTTGLVNGATITLANTTSSLIPFGTLSAGSSVVAAHDITVTTNASNGYATTVHSAASHPLTSGGADIDGFSGTNGSPIVWSSPAGSTPSVNTGFFGYTTSDSSLLTGTSDRFTSSGGNKWAGFTTTPSEIAYSPASVLSGETTRVGWQIEINSLQPAGSYTGTVILVTTPTY